MARLVKGVMAHDEDIAELDALTEARFLEYPHAEVIRGLAPGVSTTLGAEFTAATSSDMDAFVSADRPVPGPCDSGRVSGNL